ncbi:hypothetical protein ACCS96_26690, partial [Rhizobium ruizarguesonis]
TASSDASDVTGAIGLARSRLASRAGGSPNTQLSKKRRQAIQKIHQKGLLVHGLVAAAVAARGLKAALVHAWVIIRRH